MHKAALPVCLFVVGVALMISSVLIFDTRIQIAGHGSLRSDAEYCPSPSLSGEAPAQQAPESMDTACVIARANGGYIATVTGFAGGALILSALIVGVLLLVAPRRSPAAQPNTEFGYSPARH